MQKIIRIVGDATSEINKLLECGWRVCKIAPAMTSCSSSSSSVCYVVIEKEDGDVELK